LSGVAAPRTAAVRGEVALGGAVGTLVRAGVVAGAIAAATGSAPLAILAVNLLGAWLLGRWTARAATDRRTARWIPAVGGGFLGGLTTFSALALELAIRVDGDEVAVAVVLAIASVLGGVAAAAAGIASGERGTRTATSVRGRPRG
jgi:fluoride exporter